MKYVIKYMQIIINIKENTNAIWQEQHFEFD